MNGERSPLAWVQAALSQFGLRRVLFERRSEPRKPAQGDLAITWRDVTSLPRHAHVEVLNTSERGVAFRGAYAIPEGQIIGIRRGEGICRAVVRHTRSAESKYITGVELCETYRVPIAASHLELS